MKKTSPNRPKLSLNKKTIINLNHQAAYMIAGKDIETIPTFPTMTSYSGRSCGDPVCNTATNTNTIMK